MTLGLQLILLLLIAGSVTYYTWCAISISRFFSPTQPPIKPLNQPVSVLIPVCGVDEDGGKNWNSFCQQDYENYEVLFGVMDPQDPAIPILEALVARFPGRARLISCREVRGINYQVSNHMHLLEAARHEVVVFVDSDMQVTPDYLLTITAPLADLATGVVTCPYAAHNPKFLVAALGSLGRCIDFFPSMLINSTLSGGMQCAFGSTIATRKSVLEEIGGLKNLVNRAASDYYIGNLAAAAGYRVELSRYVVETDSGRESLRQLFLRELRWSRVSRKRSSMYYNMAWIYGIVYCIPLLLIAGTHSWAIVVCLVTLTARVVQALVSIYSMGCPKLIRWLWALPIRDLMTFTVWVAGAFGETVYWRGRRLRLGVDGMLSE